MLLVDGVFQKAWRAAGFSAEPTIIAPRLETALNVIGQPPILFAGAGGGTYSDVTIRLPAACEGPKSLVYPAEAEEHIFRLRDFVESCGLFYEGKRITRREVIKYVANKMGGAHLDFRRLLNRREESYMFLDRNFNTFTINVDGVKGLNGICFELLSIGQLLVRSPDVQEFMNSCLSGKPN